MRNALGQFVASHTGNAGLSSDKVRNFTLEMEPFILVG